MKLIAPVLIFLMSLGYVYSQPVFTLKGGININDIIVESAPFLPTRLYEKSIGFHVGVISQFSLLKKLVISPELQFIQKGASSEETKVNLNYLELPLMISFTPIRILSIEMGPSASYLLSTNKNDLSEAFNEPFDFGLTSGVKINLSNKFSILGRYYYGFSSVRSFPTTSPDFNPSAKNKNFQFSLCYSLKRE
jgi:hypothetical protein